MFKTADFRPRRVQMFAGMIAIWRVVWRINPRLAMRIATRLQRWPQDVSFDGGPYVRFRGWEQF